MSEDPRSNGARRDMVESWTVTADRLEVRWGDGHESRYAFLWLRDWCSCGECTNRQLVDNAAMLELPSDCAPRAVKTDGDGALRVTWDPDGHQSVYDAPWLRAHCPAPVAGPHGRSGAALAGELPVVDYGAVQGSDASQLALLETVRDYGFALMHGVPTEPDEVERVANHLGYVPGGWRYAAQPEEISVSLVRASESERADAFDFDAEGEAPTMDHERYLRTLLVPHTDFSFTSWPTGLFVFRRRRRRTLRRLRRGRHTPPGRRFGHGHRPHPRRWPLSRPDGRRGGAHGGRHQVGDPRRRLPGARHHRRRGPFGPRLRPRPRRARPWRRAVQARTRDGGVGRTGLSSRRGLG